MPNRFRQFRGLLGNVGQELGQVGRGLDQSLTNIFTDPTADPEQNAEAARQGRLSLMNALLGASGPSTRPISFGQALGTGLQSGQQAASDRLNLFLERDLLGSQIAKNRAETGLREAQSFAEIFPTADPETTLGKINADAAAGNISEEAAQFLRDAEVKKDAISIGQAETALRKEYSQVVSGPAESLQSLQNARNLIAAGNPIALQAAFTSFIRAIDNSVVRPSEQATYQNISGLAAALENRISQLVGQGPLGATDKQNLVESVDALASELEGIVQRTQDFYSGLAKDSALKSENVVPDTFRFENKPISESPKTSIFGDVSDEPVIPAIRHIP